MRAGLRTPDASIAGAHSRRRKLSRFLSPLLGAGKINGVSSLAGMASSAARARLESGTWRLAPEVLPSWGDLGRHGGERHARARMGAEGLPQCDAERPGLPSRDQRLRDCRLRPGESDEGDLGDAAV